MSEKRGKKQIADAQLNGLKNEDFGEAIGDIEIIEEVEETGTFNAPPLELTKEVEAEIMAKQLQDDEKRKETKSNTEEFTNGKNEWKLINKVYNNVLGWEHTTMAMRVGTRGVIVHVKEALDQKVNSTSTYIDNGKLVQDKDGKWFIH